MLGIRVETNNSNLFVVSKNGDHNLQQTNVKRNYNFSSFLRICLRELLMVL